GDAARLDADGYFWIIGRIDDVINVSGSGDTPAAGHRPVGALSDRDIDQLARLLAAPVSRLLRAELRLERERFGRLRDATR
ncbi:hypothetical protein, partial [Frankia sp. AgKG'84/4]|uniref:hypothetical protein n=1 Tax=Frankia sp. AgKG'84/4 TaxID=573490 RepID=UPI00202AA007